VTDSDYWERSRARAARARDAGYVLVIFAALYGIAAAALSLSLGSEASTALIVAGYLLVFWVLFERSQERLRHRERIEELEEQLTNLSNY
jgi:hypothetical protein